MPEVRRSATEARLLAFLTSTPGQEFHTRELMRRIDGNPRPVQLALEKLLRDGLLDSRRVGPLRMWSMDPRHPLYASLRDLYARTVGVAAQLRSALSREKRIHYAFIFGSYARGDDDARSDIDLFIVGGQLGEAVPSTVRQLEERLGRTINVVLWTDAELEERVRQKAPFLATLIDEPKIWIAGGEDEFERRTEAVVRAKSRGRPRDPARPGRRAGKARARTTKSPARSRAGRQRS